MLEKILFLRIDEEKSWRLLYVNDRYYELKSNSEVYSDVYKKWDDWKGCNNEFKTHLIKFTTYLYDKFKNIDVVVMDINGALFTTERNRFNEANKEGNAND